MNSDTDCVVGCENGSLVPSVVTADVSVFTTNEVVVLAVSEDGEISVVAEVLSVSCDVTVTA